MGLLTGTRELSVSLQDTFPRMRGLATKSASNSRPELVTIFLGLPSICSGSSGHTKTRSPRTTSTPKRCIAFMTDGKTKRSSDQHHNSPAT